MRETGVQSLSREDPLEKEMAPHSSTLAWRIPWMEEPGGLQSMGSSDFTFTFRHEIVKTELFLPPSLSVPPPPPCLHPPPPPSSRQKSYLLYQAVRSRIYSISKPCLTSHSLWMLPLATCRLLPSRPLESPGNWSFFFSCFPSIYSQQSSMSE